LIDLLRGEEALLARFAHLIETFSTPHLGVFSTIMATVGVGAEEIDVKRTGIFPIVHGVRTLALGRGILAPSTGARIDALVDAGALERAFGQELLSALRVFMEFRLDAQIEALRRAARERESVVVLKALTSFDRDILRDALRIVRQFRDIVRTRFNLAAF